MNSNEIRQRFLDFFEKRGHVIIPSASLIPEDKTVLFTTAGMQPLVPYLLGEPHPKGKRLADSQKCLRTDDIDEVGDNRHLTFFEMLGNWSLGDYFKKESIAWSAELLTSKTDGFGIDPKRLYITVFYGDKEMGVERDDESIEYWVDAFKELGVEASLGNRIYAYSKDKNWWELAGPGPCGPDTEIFYETDIEHDPAYGVECHVNCDCGRFVEIWNNVFMEYEKTINKDGGVDYSPLKQKNVDTGMGFERLVMLLQGKENVFETDLFQPIIDLLPQELSTRAKRIVADHFRASAFLISDGVRPSNKEAGYILRRLIRRAVVHFRGDAEPIFEIITSIYKESYKELDLQIILDVFNGEKKKFENTLEKGLRELEKLENLDAKGAFKLYESFGLPFDVIKDIGGEKTKNLDKEDFDKELERHKEISRAGSEKKFGGHGLILNTGELKASDEEELKKVTRLHTATHLLQSALRKVLGPEVEQRGSDITAKRLRFDFTYPEKLTPEQIKEVEELVNLAVRQGLPMQKKTMPLEEAKKTGALYFFNNKYPEEVDVYFAGETLEEAFSKEFCGGPHVKNTREIGKFKITKEEATSAGVRRIRADVS